MTKRRDREESEVESYSDEDINEGPEPIITLNSQPQTPWTLSESEKEYERRVDDLLAWHRQQSDINKPWTTDHGQHAMDRHGPFYIDKKCVPVGIYQEGLSLFLWDPITIAAVICEECQWGEPELRAIDYVPCKGFLCSLSANGFEFIPFLRGKTIRLAVHLASARFLKFLGFTIDVEHLSLVNHWAHLNKRTLSTAKIKDLNCRLNQFRKDNNIVRVIPIDIILKGNVFGNLEEFYKLNEPFKTLSRTFERMVQRNALPQKPNANKNNILNDRRFHKRSKIYDEPQVHTMLRINDLSSKVAKNSLGGIRDLRDKINKNIKLELNDRTQEQILTIRRKN